LQDKAVSISIIEESIANKQVTFSASLLVERMDKKPVA
jgi:hypothetical protein